VLSVVGGSPADVAGLRPEDVIIEVDGVAVASVGRLQALMIAERIGRRVPVRYVRGGEVREVSVALTELPA
jgi:serine protease Do